jgi:hypothetical protein
MVVARTKATRRVWALLTLTSIGWLRQESNQYLEMPPEVARELSPWPRALLCLAILHMDRATTKSAIFTVTILHGLKHFPET